MDSRPAVLSLCAGIGGIDLAVQRVFPAARLVCAVEIEAFAVAVLADQMAAGQLDAAPVWTDLRTFNSRDWRGCVDLLTAGFPCQPFSVAGKQRGSLDPRHLWPSVRRAINGARPGAVLLENVPGLLTVRQPDGRTAYEVVRSELQRLAYRVEAVLVTAAEVGGTHKRERLFILAVADRGREYLDLQQWGAWSELARSSESVADAGCWGDDTNQSGRWQWTSRQGAACVGEVGAHVEHAECAERWPHIDGRGHGEPRGDGQGQAASGATQRSEALARAERSRWTAPRQRCDLDTGSQPETGRRTVAHATSQRSIETTEGRESGLAVFDARRPPLWPPGPDDTAGWRYVLTHWPDLAPALESPLRGVADELPTRVDELRAFGNAVVPAQGAYALRLLLEKHGIRKAVA